MTTEKWEVAVSKQRELRSRGTEVLYDRVKLLKEVNDSAEFHEWCEENGVVALEYLRRELEDVAIDFLTLVAVLEQFPNVADWVDKGVRVLVAEVLEAQRKPRGENERQSWKARALAAEAEVARLHQEVEKRDATIAELRRTMTVVASHGQRDAA